MYEGVVQDLIDELGRLPGVGPKSAQRIAFHLLQADPVDVKRLAQVLGLDGDVLTIGFADAGSVKGFTASGHDEVLRLAIIDVVGADWTIDPVHQPAAAATRSAQPAAPAEDAPAPGSAGRRGRGRSAPAPQAEEHPGEGDDVDDDLSGADLVMRELGGQVIAEHGTAEHVRDQRGGT